MLSIPIGILFITASLAHTRNPCLKTGAIACTLSIVLFFTHPITFGTGMLIASLLVLNELLQKNKRTPLKTLISSLSLPYLPATTLTLLWILQKPAEGHFPTRWAEDFPTWLGRLTDFFTWTLSGSFGTQTLESQGLLAFFLTLWCLTYFKIDKTSRRHLIPFSTACAIYLFSPNEIAGLDSLAPRQATLILALLPGIFPENHIKQLHLKTGRNLVLVLLCTIGLTFPIKYFLDFRNESQTIHEIINNLPPKKTIVNLRNENAPWHTLHIFTWYQALKQGYTLKEFTWLHHMPIRRIHNRAARMDQIAWFEHKIEYYIFRLPFKTIETHNIENLERTHQKPLRLRPIQAENQWVIAQELPNPTHATAPNPIPETLKKAVDSFRKKEKPKKKDKKRKTQQIP
jgi:hypothetical protein